MKIPFRVKSIVALLFVLFSVAGHSQELKWQKLNETLPAPNRVYPVRCRDNNHQDDESDIKATIDGKRNTIWHSAYYPVHHKVTPETPAELVYEFENVDRIDRMVYVPRDASLNGNVTQAEVYVKTASDSDERLVGRFHWSSDSDPKEIVFKDGLHSPQSIRMLVQSGYGDWGSCAEMQFLRDEDGIKTSSLFTDELCSTLRNGLTDEDIKQEKTPVLQELARQLKNGTYMTDYRIATYSCYDSPRYLADQWKTPGKCYDILQGVTGIMMEPGKHLVMASGIKDPQKVHLKVVAWYTGKTGKNFDGGDPDIQTFNLHNGANVIDYASDWAGLAYIAYFSDGHAEDNPPIRVHFVGGTVNGYLSPDKTDEQMHLLTATAPSRFIDLVSGKVHAVWTSAGMHEFCKAADGKSPGYRQYMNLLDTLMTWEQRLVGFEKYGRIPPNRTLLYVNFTYGALFQSGLGISSHVDNERNLLNCRALLLEDSETIWGLSHEWGHQHQLSPYFCWGGLAEVTNNINSYYNVMHIGYRYDELHPGKRSGLEKAIKHYIDGTTNDCIFQSNDLFERLSPFLQLYKYFTNEGGKPDFIPDLYESLRHSNVEANPSEVVPFILNFIRQASFVSGYNLLPYFERFGFLRVTDFEIDDYGKYHYHLSQEQLDNVRQEMFSLEQSAKLKPMPAGMLEKIAKSPDKEFPRPAIGN